MNFGEVACEIDTVYRQRMEMNICKYVFDNRHEIFMVAQLVVDFEDTTVLG